MFFFLQLLFFVVSVYLIIMFAQKCNVNPLGNSNDSLGKSDVLSRYTRKVTILNLSQFQETWFLSLLWTVWSLAVSSYHLHNPFNSMILMASQRGCRDQSTLRRQSIYWQMVQVSRKIIVHPALDVNL